MRQNVASDLATQWLTDAWLQTRERPVVSNASKEVTSSTSACCTPSCTGIEIQANDERLAEFVASLSPQERRRLAEILEHAGQGTSDDGESRGL